MNRQILFRGKSVDNGEWIYGAYNNVCENTIIDMSDITHMRIDVIPETVGQFTGLTDKNGKKIFEGDIVENKNENHALIGWDVTDGYTSMLFIGRTCNSLYRLDKYQSQCVTIIGNIHDNSELLEVE